MKNINSQFTSIEHMTSQFRNFDYKKNNHVNQKVSFADVLNTCQSNQEIKFSKHALQRLENRNIKLSQNQNERLMQGINLAKEKGIKDTLIVMDTLSFIVNVPNNTVVTAMDRNEVKENIYTNIDGAVIV